MNLTSPTPVEQPQAGSAQPIGPRAGAVLTTAAGIFFAAESIAAAAWTAPPYSYTYHFISDLGVHGPSTAFGQFMYSPLAWVMNAGFILFGIAALVGILMLRGMLGARRRSAIAMAALMGIGVTLVGLFPGSGEALTNGTAVFHGLGAFAAFICGNILVILLGRACPSLGLSRRLGRALVASGTVGFVSLAAFIADVSSGANVLIGLFERGAVYSVMFGLIAVGVGLRRHRDAAG